MSVKSPSAFDVILKMRIVTSGNHFCIPAVSGGYLTERRGLVAGILAARRLGRADR